MQLKLLHVLWVICRSAYVLWVSTDVFAVVADPTRRRILRELIDEERSVGELVGSLGVSQPTVSKHLKVLRDSGFVTSRTVAQRRMYRLDVLPFAQLEAWLGPFRRKWHGHIDALEHHLENQGRLEDERRVESGPRVGGEARFENGSRARGEARFENEV